MTNDRMRRIAAQYADARRRAADARRLGDTEGARYAASDAVKLRRILEGVTL